MGVGTNDKFDPVTYLKAAGTGRKLVQIEAKANFFQQGDAADCIFYLHSGRLKLTVVSSRGKEATITLLSAGDFVGEEAIASSAGLRLATATAITSCAGAADSTGRNVPGASG